MKKLYSFLVTVVFALSLGTSSLFAATGDVASQAASDALNVPGVPTLVSKTPTSVTLEWAKVPTATAYIVKYSKNSVAEAFKQGNTTAVYDIETDQVTSTGTTISDLKTDTTYYFAVVAVDAAQNESTTNSEELAVALVADAAAATTAPVVDAAAFKLANVTVLTATTLSVEFSAAVGTETPVTLKLTKTADSSAVAVASAVVDTVDPKKVNVTLTSPLDASSSYSVTVLSAKDTAGTSISEGINAIKEFTTTANLVAVELNAAPTAEVVAATTASGATASGAVTTAAALPATGTQENLLVILAAIIAFAIVYVVRARRA